MRFIFNGSVDELTQTILCKAKEDKKDIIVNNKPNSLEIGFQRLGHTDGRFFVANIIQENNKVILDGDIKDIFLHTQNNDKHRTWTKITEWIFSYLLAYIILLVLFIIPWLFLRNVVSILIPLLLPVVYLITRKVFNFDKKEREKAEKQFIKFMSAFSKHE